MRRSEAREGERRNGERREVGREGGREGKEEGGVREEGGGEGFASELMCLTLVRDRVGWSSVVLLFLGAGRWGPRDRFHLGRWWWGGVVIGMGVSSGRRSRTTSPHGVWITLCLGRWGLNHLEPGTPAG